MDMDVFVLLVVLVLACLVVWAMSTIIISLASSRNFWMQSSEDKSDEIETLKKEIEVLKQSSASDVRQSLFDKSSQIEDLEDRIDTMHNELAAWKRWIASAPVKNFSKNVESS